MYSTRVAGSACFYWGRGRLTEETIGLGGVGLPKVTLRDRKMYIKGRRFVGVEFFLHHLRIEIHSSILSKLFMKKSVGQICGWRPHYPPRLNKCYKYTFRITNKQTNKQTNSVTITQLLSCYFSQLDLLVHTVQLNCWVARRTLHNINVHLDFWVVISAKIYYDWLVHIIQRNCCFTRCHTTRAYIL